MLNEEVGMNTEDLELLLTRCNELKTFLKLCKAGPEGLRFSLVYTVGPTQRPSSKSHTLSPLDSSVICSDIEKIISDRIGKREKQIKRVVNESS